MIKKKLQVLIGQYLTEYRKLNKSKILKKIRNIKDLIKIIFMELDPFIIIKKDFGLLQTYSQRAIFGKIVTMEWASYLIKRIAN